MLWKGEEGAEVLWKGEEGAEEGAEAGEGEMVMGKVMIMTGGVLRSVSWIDFEQRQKRRGVISPMPLVARQRGNVS